MNSNIFISLDEYKYNLNIFEQTLESQIPLDEGFSDFIAIFQSQIDQYSEDPSMANELSTLKGRVRKLKDNFELNIDAFSPVITPLLGDKKPLQVLIDTFSKSDIKEGLKKLAPHYSYRSIKGDGHCCFRAIAAGFLYNFKASSPKLQERLLQELTGRIKKFAPGTPNREINFLAKELHKLQLQQCSVEDILRNQPESDHLVQVLRQIAVGYEREQIRLHPKGTMDNALQDASDGKIKKYFSEMSREALGSDLELIALAKSLGIRISVLNPEAIGKGQSLDNLNNQFGSEVAPSIILLYRPGHYDLAMPEHAQ